MSCFELFGQSSCVTDSVYLFKAQENAEAWRAVVLPLEEVFFISLKKLFRVMITVEHRSKIKEIFNLKHQNNKKYIKLYMKILPPDMRTKVYKFYVEILKKKRYQNNKKYNFFVKILPPGMRTI